jgi:hypothetical protein
MPKFNRISLLGSEELFRPTKPEPEPMPPADEVAGRVNPPLPEPEPVPAPAVQPQPSVPALAPAPAPLARERALYRIQVSEQQVRMLVDGVQRMKYPHQVKTDQKPSIEEFEALEELRNTLLDAIE